MEKQLVMIGLGQQQDKLGTVLVVDDSAENIAILVNLLKTQYQVRVLKSAINISQVVAHFNELPDLILLDVLMPGIDGYEACRLLQSDPLTKNIPVIFITALADAEAEARGLTLGAVDYITKPFNPEIVKARVQTQVALRRERLKTELLLANMLPAEAILELKKSGRVTPHRFEHVAILFSDMVNFTKIASEVPVDFLMTELSEVFSAFDDIVEKRGVERIKLIGDAYMAACGIAQYVPDGVERMVNTGLDFLDYLQQRNQQSSITWDIRIGIHVGEVITGVVGEKKYQYDVFGDTVNIASRVENLCRPNHICITEAVKADLPAGKYSIRDLGKLEIKGIGASPLYYVDKA